MSSMDDRRDQRTENKLEAWNLQYELVDLPLDDIRIIDGAQVRELSHLAPEENVERYAIQLKAGEKFPPIVVMRPNILIDGNTRYTAAQRAKLTSFPAYLIDVQTVDVAKALAGALNMQHGQTLTVAEAQATALIMLRELRFSDEQVAREVGRSGQTVRTWRLQQQAADRATLLNLDERLKPISLNQREVIARVSHDAPFAEIVKLVSEAKPQNAPLRDLVKRVEASKSDADALQLVDEARRDWRPVGPEPRKTVVNQKSRRARMVIPQLMHLNPMDVFEPAKAEADREMYVGLQQWVENVLRVFDGRSRRVDLGDMDVAV